MSKLLLMCALFGQAVGAQIWIYNGFVPWTAVEGDTISLYGTGKQRPMTWLLQKSIDGAPLINSALAIHDLETSS